MVLSNMIGRHLLSPSSAYSSSKSISFLRRPVLSSSSTSSILMTKQQQEPKQQAVTVREMGTWPKVKPIRTRLITMDVTGTIVSFKGTLEDHYIGAAAKCGITDIDASKINAAFNKAYKETSQHRPCFGSDKISAKQWWKECVILSFRYAGVEMDEHIQDQVFQRIYSTFGSNVAYKLHRDAFPFLKWARRNGILCGVLSNADERYGDSILPMLGLTHDELQFHCYSKDYKIEKPNGQFFMAAIKQGESLIHPNSAEPKIHPSEVLHIGNDFHKDFEGARQVGIHCALLDRYGEDELADEWRRRGAPVFKDLIDIVEFLGRSECKLG